MRESNLDINENSFGEKLENIAYIDRIGVYGVVFNNEGKIATIKTSTGYFIPGGGIESSENHKQCLEREFVEETGYEINVEEYICKSSLYHISKTGQYLNGIGYFYFVHLKNMVINKIEFDHELLWLEPNDCMECLFLEHQSWAISKALEYKI